jgi:hypothetical protein
MEWSDGMLYPVLHRLERLGQQIQDARAEDALLQAWKSDPGQENVGRCFEAVPGPP